MDKSYVGMGHKLCPICGTKHDEVVLLDKRLRETLTRDMMMGYELCPEHAAMSDEYVALVEVTCDPNRYEDAEFTGRTAHVRWAVADDMFSVDMSRAHPFVFVEPEVMNQLVRIPQAGD